MKKIIGLSIFFLIFLNQSSSQNEFGTVGSYWRYNFEPHSGGNGWTMITIEKDTIINGVEFKKYSWKHHVQIGFYPAEEFSSFGFLRIENDTVYNDKNAMIDFTMGMNDTLNLGGLAVDIQLVVDSITTETIDGFDYKKWYGQKICVKGANTSDPYESFTILESVGQVDNGYLFWNIDGCAIGGGTNTFVCYNNGSFTYPPNVACEKLLLASKGDTFGESNEELYPNPAVDLIRINSNNKSVDQIKISSIRGEVVFESSFNEKEVEIDIKGMRGGIYFVEVYVGDKVLVKKLVVAK